MLSVPRDLRRSVLLSFITASILGASQCAAGEKLRTHELDTQIWPSGRSTYKSVSLITNEEEALSHSMCLHEKSKAFFQSKADGLALGEACGILVVAFSTSPPLSELEKRFVLAHESFHLLGQIFNQKVDSHYFSRLRPRLSKDDIGSANEFFAKISSTSNICKEMEKSSRDLSRASIDYINYISVTEWPAEYYTHQKLLSDKTVDASEYFRIRERFGMLYEYYSGAVVGLWLDEKFIDWKHHVSSGEPMLSIAAEKCGVEWPISSRPLLMKIDSMPAFVEK